MKWLWLTPIISLHYSQAIQESPLDRASLSASNLSTTTSNASTVSAIPALDLTTSLPVSPNVSQEGTATSGRVTVVKTIELIPQPVSGDSGARSNGFSERSPGASVRQTKLATISPSAKLSAISSGLSLSGQVSAPHATGQLDKSSMLQPIIVGGITYASNNAADHASRSNGLDHVAMSLWHGEAGLPPVIAGGLTYTQVAKDLHSGLLPAGPMNVEKAVTETGKLAAISLIKGSESHLAHPISMPTQYLAAPGALSAVLSQSESLTLPTSSFAAISSQLIIPASPSVFIIASQTFTAYPSGLAIAGNEVFQGSTAITVSSTTISLGRSDIVVGTSTVPFASITGLGAALSSGLVPTVTSAPGVGSGPAATATSAKESHQSAGGESGRRVEMVIVWLLKSNFACVSSAMWFHDSRPSLGSGQSIYPICMISRTAPGELEERIRHFSCFLNHFHIPRFQQWLVMIAVSIAMR